MKKPVCAIIGIGPKNGEAFARRFSAGGYAVAMLSRSADLSARLAAELPDASSHACDASDPDSVADRLAAVAAAHGPVDVLIYNAGAGSWKSIDDITTAEFELGWRVNALGLLAASQAVIPAMREKGAGNIVVVGATASLRGKPMTTGFAAAKAAQRSLAQSIARHVGPEGIHVSLMIIDGQIALPGAPEALEGSRLDPNDIAESAWHLTCQPKSAWTFEVDLRPRAESW